MAVSTTLELADAYRTLGVTSSMTFKEIKSAYRQIMRTHHADFNSDPAAHAIASKATVAWKVVQDAEAEMVRRRNDATVVLVRIGGVNGHFHTEKSGSIEKYTLYLPLAYCQQNERSLVASFQMRDMAGKSIFSPFGMNIVVLDGARTAFRAPSVWQLESSYLAYLVA